MVVPLADCSPDPTVLAIIAGGITALNTILVALTKRDVVNTKQVVQERTERRTRTTRPPDGYLKRAEDRT